MEALKETLVAIEKKQRENWVNGDLDAIADTYTEDCRIMPPGHPESVGRDAWKAMLHGLKQAGMFKSPETECLEVVDMGDYAVERRRQYYLNDDGSIQNETRHLVLWKKVNGEFFVHMSMFNNNSQE